MAFQPMCRELRGRGCPTHRLTTRSSIDLRQAADEAPAAAQFADRQHQLIAAFLQRQVDGIILWVHDAQEPGIAEALRAAPAVEDLAVEEDAYVIAVADLELLHLVAVRIDGRPRIDHFHP